MAYTIVPANGTSSQIVNLDGLGTPAGVPVRATAGQAGGAQRCLEIIGYALAPINMPTTDFLPLVRIPTNCVVHSVSLALDATPSTSLTGSLGLTFSDSYNALGMGGDGTPAAYASTYALTGAAPSIVSQSFFLYQTAIQTYTAAWKDVTFANFANSGSVTDGFYIPSAAGKPLWQALTTGAGAATSGASPGAFTTCQVDPGGFFDIVWFETTTGVNTAAVNLSCRVLITVDNPS